MLRIWFGSVVSKLVRKILLWISLSLTVCTTYAITQSWQDNSIIIDKTELHYYQGGSGSPIILLSGYATTSNFWSKKFVNCLAKRHTVYLLDYLGIGTNADPMGSDTITAMANNSYIFSQGLSLNKPDIIGWSMGGAVAQQMSFSYPESLGKIVLISPLMLDNQPVESGTVESLNLDSRLVVLNYVFANNLYNYNNTQLTSYAKDLFAPLRRLFPSNQIGVNQRVAMDNWVADLATQDGMLKSEKEYLIMIANQDKMLNPLQTEEESKLFTHVQVVKFEGSGHDIMLQAPQQACEQVENFLHK